MAAEIVTGIAVAGAEGAAEKIAGCIAEVFFIQQFKDCCNLEENHEYLNQNVIRMEARLSHVRTRSQKVEGVLPDPATICITKMEEEVKKAKDLSVRVEQRRSRCLDCWNLCYPGLSTECREWKTKFDKLFKEVDDEFNFVCNIEQILPAAEARPLLLHPVPDAGFVGSDIKSAEMRLQTWLTQPPHRVVGVWGMGGIGKTSLLKMVHNHFQKVSTIFEIVIWVTVSKNFKIEGNFNIEGFYNSIAKVLDMKLDEKIDSSRARTELCTFLENKKFLLILDDLWEPIDFNEVGFSFGNVDKGSKVLISTRSYQVIAAMGAKDSCWEMKPLLEEEAWKVFKSKAFTNDPDENIEAIAKEIAKKCRGLPLALNAVGAAMSSNKSKEEDWSLALSVMGTADQDFQANIDKQLRYSYDVLSKKLKICFLCCAAFAEDAEIDADRLVEIWIAEGLLGGGQTTHLMNVGRDYLNQLAKRCLIDSSDHFLQRTIKVHDVVREMAIRIGESESEERCLFATNQHRTDFPGEIEVSNCKRISLGHNDIQDLPTDLMECPNLVSLFLHSNQKLSHVPEQFLRSVTSLRVLDLSETGITRLPISVGELRLLEFLDLSDCRELIELPVSIGNLSELQFFNLESCWKLEGWPSTIRGLKKLKHLNLDRCHEMQVNSDDIGQLTSLNRLVVGNKIAVRAGDVINLTKMQVLKACVTADGGDVVTIDTWTEMKDLTLDFYSDGINIEKIERVEMLHLIRYRGVTLPHCEFQKLKVLELVDCREVRELPLWSFPMLTVLNLHWLHKLESLSGSMSKLEVLSISSCPLLEELPWGMRLPNLKELTIERCDRIKELDIGNGNLPMLERLELVSLFRLESITGSSGVWNGATSNLQRVVIECCPLLEKMPLGMRLPNLKELKIKMCRSIKELYIGNGDFPMLERLEIAELEELESITGSSGVRNEEATSNLESVEITGCPLLRRLPRAMEKLFSLNKLHWEDRDESVVLSELFGE